MKRLVKICLFLLCFALTKTEVLAIEKNLFNIVNPQQQVVTDPFAPSNALPGVREERSFEDKPKTTIKPIGWFSVMDYDQAYKVALNQRKNLIIYAGTNLTFAKSWQDYADRTGQIFCIVSKQDYPEFVDGITETQFNGSGFAIIKKAGVTTTQQQSQPYYYYNSQPQQQFYYYQQPQRFSGCGGGSCGPSG